MARNNMSADDLPYRPCVGIMVLNDRGLAWAGRRIVQPDTDELSGATQLWQMPQGGVDRGEDPREAAYRELYEETGIKSVSFLAETPEWITYDLPEHLIGVALKGKYRGQKQKWFALRFEGQDTEIAINPPPGGHEAEFDMWEWKPMTDLPKLIVPFKRKVYDSVVDAFRHLAP
ncbi:RNA pyrophosphohydrolase [Nitratireductor rhodophyticola]|uniref:RNA pyrophosphohydrolase n=1 Tax=Nitratireductor rhodophyticola TaxID=2854036 RepID=A0ABS7R5M7_9HYPH|nr:RNA pyrophosphohydrolase [Nitratireductor rhodophyticola]MBY8916227.1 RNA pyrophosphohydrolase [Nitratireductor rhodophyticola]MBY8921590.1 RNA pyrophosphohydrolase [Nitratireductor rhodophyticola]MEC9246695.1 RNA pyrophosphohydrolase [Pseudomonadota bacterium]WPZ15642.1 RNA pyrophosphohydrolase [Nitratireductor rhodophyticola]